MVERASLTPFHRNLPEMHSLIPLIAHSPFAPLEAGAASTLLFLAVSDPDAVEEWPDQVDGESAGRFCAEIDHIPLLVFDHDNMGSFPVDLGCLWHRSQRTGAVYIDDPNIGEPPPLAPLETLSSEALSAALQSLLKEQGYLPENLDMVVFRNSRPDLLPRENVQHIIASVYERDGAGGDPQVRAREWMTGFYAEPRKPRRR